MLMSLWLHKDGLRLRVCRVPPVLPRGLLITCSFAIGLFIHGIYRHRLTLLQISHLEQHWVAPEHLSNILPQLVTFIGLQLFLWLIGDAL